jgi:hypothetical protein
MSVEQMIAELADLEHDIAEEQAVADRLKALAQSLRLRIEYALITLKRGT